MSGKLRLERDGQRRALKGEGAWRLVVPRRLARQLELLPLGATLHCSWPEYGTPILRSIDKVEPPAALAQALAAWERGDAAAALHALDHARDVEGCPVKLAWRARWALEVGRDEQALADLERLLGQPEGVSFSSEPLSIGGDTAPRPPGLRDLVDNLAPASLERFAPALAERARRSQLDDPDVRRLLDRLAPRHWPLSYVRWRLRRGSAGGSLRQIAAREAQRRLEADELSERDRGRLQQALASDVGEPLVAAPVRPHPIFRAARGPIPKALWPQVVRHAFGRAPDLNGPQAEALGEELLGQLRARGVTVERPRYGWYHATEQCRSLARQLATAIVQSDDRDAQATTLLEQLDQRLLRGELRGLLHKRELAAIEGRVRERLQNTSGYRVLQRCFNASARPRLWLLGLGPAREQRYGLLCERDGTWLWVEGGADDVLCSVPEPWFAEVVETLEG